LSSARSDLPTLTEVIELQTSAESAYAPAAPMPVQDESVALDDDGPDTLQHDQPTPEHGLLHLRTPAELQALAQEEELVAQVLVRLQPRLEAWVEAQVRHALMDMLPVWTESAALSIARDLRAEMPELLSLALDEVHRQRSDKGG
jgi:hypothetical protein